MTFPLRFRGAALQAPRFLLLLLLCSSGVSLRAQEDPALANVSTRGNVGRADDALIGGFIIAGTQPRTVLIRVQGPSLSVHGVSDVLADPTCELFSGNTRLASFDDWETDAGEAAAVRARALQPGSPREPAFVRQLNPGSYTVVARGKQDTTGVGLIEVFDVDPKSPASPSRTFNMSTRGRVGQGDKVMIMGFIIGGATAREILVTAIGGSLAEYSVPNTLADPTLEINSGGQVIAQADDWIDSADFDRIARTGFSPRNPLEPAVLVRLPPGSYTAIVRGSGGTEGVALPEIYDLRESRNLAFSVASLADRKAQLAVSTGGAPETLQLNFIGAAAANVGGGANGTYTYTLKDDFRAELSLTASGYTLNGSLKFYRNQVAVFDGTLQKPGAASQAAGGILVVQ